MLLRELLLEVRVPVVLDFVVRSPWQHRRDSSPSTLKARDSIGSSYLTRD
jgi:hypothetical protein